MHLVEAPVLHKYPEAPVGAQSSVDWPWQILLLPVIAQLGNAVTVTAMIFEVELPQEFELVTKNPPLEVTVMEDILDPLLQVPPLLFPESTTDPPEQNVVGPPAVMVDGDGTPLKETVLLFILMAPAVDSALPEMEAPDPKLMAPLATTVPEKLEPAPILNAPFIRKYTLHIFASLIRETLEPAETSKAPSIFITKMALGLLPPFKVKTPFMVEAAPMV